MDGLVIMSVQEYLGNCTARSSADEAVNFMKNYCIVVYKPYGG